MENESVIFLSNHVMRELDKNGGKCTCIEGTFTKWFIGYT